MFFCAGTEQQYTGDGGNDLQIIVHILIQTPVFPDLFTPLREIINHTLVHINLLVNAGNHNALIHRLVFPANVVSVKIHVQIIQVFHIGQRLKYIEIVHIKSVSGQLQATFPKQLGAEDHRMHQDIMPFGKMMAVLPGKQLVLRQDMPIIHDLLAFFPLFLIDKVADQHVQYPAYTGLLPQRIQYLAIRFFLDPVIAVHHFEIKACGILNTCVHRSAVSAVFLVYHLHNGGILGCVRIRDFRRAVLLRTVVHYDDLHVLAAGQQGINTFAHIVL